jgi:hypothetical protein
VKASRFFYPLRKQWYIINNGNFAIVVSHQSVRTVYHHALACIKNFRNDDIQGFALILKSSIYAGLDLIAITPLQLNLRIRPHTKAAK